MSVSAGVHGGMADKASLRATIDAMIDPQVRLDAVRDDHHVIVDFVFAEANHAACEYIGTAYDALIGSSLLEQSPATVSTGLMQEYVRVVETGEPLILDDWRSPRTDPAVDPRHLDLRAAKLGDGFVLTWRDVTARHQALEALAASEARLRLLLDNAADVVFQVGERGTIDWISPSVTRVLGWNPDEVLGMPMHHLVHRDELATGLAGLATLVRREQSQVTMRVLHKDGTYRWVDTSATPLHDERGNLASSVAIWRDVTAVHDARERLANVIESVGLGTWEWNVPTGELVVNERWAEMLGYTVSELAPVTIGTWRDLTLPESLAEADRKLEEHWRGEAATYRCDTRMRHKDGSVVWVRTTGRLASRTPEGEPLVMYGTHKDITDEKHAELALAASQQQLQATVDTLQVAQDAADLGVWVWEFSDSTLHMDSRLADWYEIPDEAHLSGKVLDYWRSRLHPEDRARVEALVANSVELRQPFSDDFRMLNSSGTVRHIHSDGTVEYDRWGTALRMVGIHQDVTPQRELEQQLRDANAELERVARIDPLTEVPNRLAGLDFLRDEFSRMRRTRSPYGVLMIDLDDFKDINDTFGHATGDKALHRAAQILRGSLRETDRLARFGGEEFVALLPDTGPAGAAKVAEGIRRAVEADVTGWGRTLTVSVGVAIGRPDDEDEMSALARADHCMYRAKADGRNRVVSCEG